MVRFTIGILAVVEKLIFQEKMEEIIIEQNNIIDKQTQIGKEQYEIQRKQVNIIREIDSKILEQDLIKIKIS